MVDSIVQARFEWFNGEMDCNFDHFNQFKCLINFNLVILKLVKTVKKIGRLDASETTSLNWSF